MHKSATKCNETIGKWCKNKHGASKIIDMFETYQTSNEVLCEFTALSILKKNVEETRARVLAGQGVHNLALNAKVVSKQGEGEEEIYEEECWSPEDLKFALHEHLALNANAF
jgi:hypothetical protein